MTKTIVFLFVLFLAGSAWAQVAGVADVVTTKTLSVTSGNCLLENAGRKALTLDNSSAINMGYCEAASGSGTCTAAIGSGGTTTIPAGSVFYWPRPSAPANAFCFIAASATPALTIKEGM